MSQSDYIEIEIDTLPPGVNRTYIHKAGGGGVTLTRAAREWDTDAALIVGSAAGQFDFEPDPTADYQIVIRWWGGRHDADAHLKIVQDCVTRKLGFDDRQIRECVIQRCPGPGNINDDTRPEGMQVYLFTCLERNWVSSLILEALGVMDMSVSLAEILQGRIGAI
jgi:Holliday junction resolvase RusA-like endonuclease